MTSRRFPIRIGPRSRWLIRLFTARPETAYVDVDGEPGGSIAVRFGRARLATPIANLASWRIEGPFHWITAIGIRMSVRHKDISFAGSAHGGVRLDLREPVRWGPFRVPAIYVGADDLEALAAELTRLGVGGTDARARLVR